MVMQNSFKKYGIEIVQADGDTVAQVNDSAVSPTAPQLYQYRWRSGVIQRHRASASEDLLHPASAWSEWEEVEQFARGTPLWDAMLWIRDTYGYSFGRIQISR